MQEPVERREDGVHGPLALLIQNAKGDQLGVRRDALERLAVRGDEPGDESTVAARVEPGGGVTDEVVLCHHRSVKIGVSRDTRVHEGDGPAAAGGPRPGALGADDGNAWAGAAGWLLVVVVLADRRHGGVGRDERDA